MLSRIDLRFFKCFEELELPLAPLTLLAGLNASGKSSILQALVLLHQTMREHEWTTRLALNGSGLRLGTTSDVVNEVLGRTSFEVALEADGSTYNWSFDAERTAMSMRVLHVSINGERLDEPDELHFLLPHDRVRDGESSASMLAQRLRDLTYITAERIAPQETYDLEDPHAVSVVGPRGEHTASLLHWGRDEHVLEELVLPDIPPQRLHQTAGHMRSMFPGCLMDLREIPRTNTVSLGLKTSDDTDFHRPIHTGFGLTQCLPIVVAVLSASKGDIILVENPEVHLHPAGQAQIGGFLADAVRAGLQVLVETHSDHVLNGIRRAVKANQLPPEAVALHFFRPRSECEGGRPQVESPIMDAAGNIDNWPDGFFDQFDKDANYFAGWSEAPD